MLGAAAMMMATGGFSPASLFAAGEVGAWYDPADIGSLWQDTARTTPVTASGQVVGAMDDLSGNGLHMIARATGARPVYTVSGGLSYLAFDGIDDGMSVAYTTVAQFVASMAAGNLPGVNAELFGAYTASTTKRSWRFRDNTSGNAAVEWSASGGAPVTTISVTVGSGGFQVMFESTTAARRSIVNGSVLNTDTTAGTPLTGANTLRLGRDETTFCAAFRFYGAVVRNGTLTTAQRSALSQWHMARAGV